jgi:hypothetical protein
MLRKSFCFSMRRKNALWGHFSAKSFVISTNGTIRSESSLWRDACYGMSARRARTIRLDLGGPDHLAPFLGFRADEVPAAPARLRSEKPLAIIS